jgi:hypothetical protein
MKFGKRNTDVAGSRLNSTMAWPDGLARVAAKAAD